MSTISASTTSTTAFKITTDTTGALVFQTGSSPTTALTLDTSQNATLVGNIRLNNGAADGAQLSLASSGYSDWNIDNYSGNFRWYYNATEYMRLDATGNLGLGVTPSAWSTVKAIQNGNSYFGNINGGNAYFGNNAYYNGSNWIWASGSGSATAAMLEVVGNSFIFKNAASGTAGGTISFTQPMTLDASGNLLVARTAAEGTTPSKIQVVGSGNLSSVTVTRANTAGIYLAESTNTSNYGTGIWFDHGSLMAGIASSRVSTGNWGTDLRFYTHPTTTSGVNETYERGRFSAAGDFELYITPAKDGKVQWTSGAGGSAQGFIVCNGNPELIAQCGGSGGVKLTSGATSWVSASDIRSKDIIEPIANAIQKVGSLSSVIYSFKDDVEQTRRVGLIAQEVLAVLPEAVYVPSDEEEMLGVRYTEVVPLLVAAIKELNAKVVALENK